MRLYIYIILTIFLLSNSSSNVVAQNDRLEYEEFFGGTNPAAAQSKKLVYLDFWASWCIPCIKVMPHIEYQQELYGADVYFASISSESSYVIKKFLKKHPVGTSVIRDYNKSSHEKFGIHALPFAILLDRTGRIVWKGHPSELSHQQLSIFIRRAPSSGNGVRFVKKENEKVYAEEDYESVDVKQMFKKYNFKYYFSDTPLSGKSSWDKEVYNYEGTVSGLISEILEVPVRQVVPKDFKSKYIKIHIPAKAFNSYKSDLISFLESELHMELTQRESADSVLVLRYTENSRMMSSEEVTYGEGMTIVSDNNIEADAISCNEFASLLSENINEPVMFENAPDGKYDWKIHIKYPNLMMEQLQNEFMFDISRRYIESTIYTMESVPK